MLFEEPLSFDEAIASRKAKALLPTNLSSDELSRIRPKARELSTFSAKVGNAKHLQKLDDLIDTILDPSEGIGWEQAMTELSGFVKSIGYNPATGEAGTITDLASQQRIRLQIETNTALAYGAGQEAQMQDAETLDEYPAAELVRWEPRMEERDWETIWDEAGGPRTADGRKIALMNDDIWDKISDFGLPYPPFKFNSGVGKDPVDRESAEADGVIKSNQHVIPEQVDYAEPESEVEISDDLKQQILDDLGPAYEFQGNKLMRI